MRLAQLEEQLAARARDADLEKAALGARYEDRRGFEGVGWVRGTPLLPGVSLQAGGAGGGPGASAD